MAEYQKHRPSLAVTTTEGNQFGIAEVGARQPKGRPQWVRELAQRSCSHAAVFVTYFDRCGVKLTDPPSQQPGAKRSVAPNDPFANVESPVRSSVRHQQHPRRRQDSDPFSVC
jgi:hypothetical protein